VQRRAFLLWITALVLIGLTPKHTTGRREWARAAPPSPPMGPFGVNPIGRTALLTVGSGWQSLSQAAELATITLRIEGMT